MAFTVMSAMCAARSPSAPALAVRITTPHGPLPAADAPEDHVLASDARITETVRKYLEDE